MTLVGMEHDALTLSTLPADVVRWIIRTNDDEMESMRLVRAKKWLTGTANFYCIICWIILISWRLE